MKILAGVLVILSLLAGCEDKEALAKYKADAEAAQTKASTIQASLDTTQQELQRSKQNLAQALQTIEQLKGLNARQKEELAKSQKETNEYQLALQRAQSELAKIKGIAAPADIEQPKTWDPAQLADGQMKILLRALEAYKVDTGSYPTTEQGLKVLLKNKKNGKEPYLKEISKDPWGRDYQYRMANNVCEIRTLGADGKKGGSGEDTDLKISGQ